RQPHLAVVPEGRIRRRHPVGRDARRLSKQRLTWSEGMQYTDFELEMTGALTSNAGTRTGNYQVRVLRSPVGEMKADQAVPVVYDDKDLQYSLDQLEQRELDTDGLIKLGRTLATILLPPSGVREHFAQSLARIPSDQGLRLRLRLPYELSVIPWEYAFVERA